MLLDDKWSDDDSADKFDDDWRSFIVNICINRSSFTILEWSDARRE